MIIDSMAMQHAKWIEHAERVPWRADIPSLNYLLTSTCWRNDHNGFSHQGPGFIDTIIHRKPVGGACLSAARRELPALRRRSLLPQRQLPEPDRHRQAAPTAMADDGGSQGALRRRRGHLGQPTATSPTSPTSSSPAPATSRPRRRSPPPRCCAATSRNCSFRVVNVVDLMRLCPANRHPHGMSDEDFVAHLHRERARAVRLSRLSRRHARSAARPRGA